MNAVEIINGDALAEMRKMEDGAFHLTFTSPPYYNAKEYSRYESYAAYLDFMRAAVTEIHRITAAGRFFVINTSPVIEARESRDKQSRRRAIPFDLHGVITDCGWEFIDDIIWVKPEASVKNRNGGFYQHRKPLAWKPNAVTEYVMVYRKATDKLIDWNIKAYDKAAVDASLVTGEYESSNVWRIPPVSDKAHPATFPQRLCDNIIRYYSFVGDRVLDPFCGSGTTLAAAAAARRIGVGIEQSAKYCEIAKRRIGE